jgi:tRNA modification GTPase
LLVTLIDTAGLRPTPGRLEALGIERTRQALRSSNLALLVLPPGSTSREADRWTEEAAGCPVLRIFSKSDLEPAANGRGLLVSGRTGAGVAELEQTIVTKLWGKGIPQAIDLTSERHADAVRRASDCLDRALSAVAGSTLEVVSGEVGLAFEALGEITGENAPDALLDAIFQRFCIGK